METTGFKNIHEILTSLQDIASVMRDRGLVKEIHDADSSLAAGSYNVAFLGQFKRGKSTLINSIIKRELLPADVAPLTSVITIIQYGGIERASVHYMDGSEKIIPLEDISLYASEEGNPENRKGVGFVLLDLPLPLLSEGIRLVDTPGVGSIFKHNGDATRSFLERVDVAVFVLGSDPPVSGEEIELVKSILPLSTHNIFIMNKSDRVDDITREKASVFTRKVLSEALGYDPGLILHISALGALKGKPGSGLDIFLERLEKISSGSRNDIVLRSASKAASHFAFRLLQRINLEIAVLLTPVNEIENKIAKFEAELKDIDDLILAVWSRAKNEIAYDIESWESEKRSVAADIKQCIISALEKAFTESECRKGRIANYALETARIEMKNHMDNWTSQTTKWVSRNYSMQAEKVSEETNRLITRVAEAASKAFGTPVSMYEAPKSSFDTTGITYEFIDPRLAFDLNDWLIPIINFFSPRKAVVGRAIRRTGGIIDGWLMRNFYSVDEHVTEWIDKATRQLLSSMNSRLESVRREIMDAISTGRKEKGNGVTAVSQRLSFLESQKERTDELMVILSQEKDAVEMELNG